MIDPSNFVIAVRPLLEGGDCQALTTLLRQHWTSEEIASLLKSDCPEARKVSALCLALVGDACCLRKLVENLADADPMVNQMAEHALWSIWLRNGKTEAASELCRGIQAMGRREFDSALEHMGRAIELDPQFAEAFNQRAIVHHLQDEWEESACDCRHVLELMPDHFGAWAGLGHSHFNRGELTEALRCYEKALAINPHLDCIGQAVNEIRQKLDSADSAECPE